jgi:hypothetical protein
VLVENPTHFLSAGTASQRVRAHAVRGDGRGARQSRSIYLGVSGDGDSASIGLGQFAHIMRRGVNMVYIVGTTAYTGLPKGVFRHLTNLRQSAERSIATSPSTLQLAWCWVRRSYMDSPATKGNCAADQGRRRAQGCRIHRRRVSLCRLQQSP